ncbi:mandelate racemase/muconate lactonizing enzyme family protein [Halegenticoccus soli]|uniref:mandelate racemase/muconate lactonizing enzyme family protein n=1 Tax=Halegenticoccus soli TaxID=1985678 RepID=UPI000C6D608C|nr:mandelate racemase/muconate lactonizing enzyme family protein [Halegenticoccus soli]
MQFADIAAHELSSPIEPPQEREFYGGTRRLLKRDVVLVAVETADGEVGYAPGGASSSAMREYFSDATHSGFVDLLEEEIAPAFAGRDLDDAADVHAIVAELDLPDLLESQAASVLDVAYHDIFGKHHGAPIYELLGDGADVARRLPLYASAGMYMPPEGYAEQAAAIRERGFAGYKYRPGLGPEEDLRTIELVREAVGEEMAVMVDAHTWWKLGERSYGFDRVCDLVEAFAEFDPYWVEEPVSPADYDAYADLSSRTSVPLAGGESEESPEGLIELAETGGVDYLQGDVRHHAGYTGCWRAVEHCRGRDVTFVPHNFGTHLGLVANAHLAAAAPGTELLEYPVFGTDSAAMYPFPLAADILTTELDISDGHLTLPDGPGLGVDVNLDAIGEYPYVEGPWTEFVYEES